jgi:glycosyltransferase involved in cell wall biosynthesis
MACGVPVVAADRSSLPEVVGEAGVLVDPYEPEAIAAGITEALDRATALSQAGRERAATFTWARSAAAHWQIYQGETP